jgi:hypothetical protein
MSDTERLNWTRAAGGDPRPCIICDQPAIMRHPVNGRPCHKVCHDQRADQATQQAIARASR